MKKSNKELSQDDRAFADLILLGYNKTEAYRKIYKTNAKGRSISVMANRQCAVPEIAAYIDMRRAKIVNSTKYETGMLEEEMQADKSAIEALETNTDLLSLSDTEKNRYIKELTILKSQCTTPMDKAKIIAQITDLKQLKKEQTEMEQQVKYYLPLPENEFIDYIECRAKIDVQFADTLNDICKNIAKK
ncbi:MAG: hypothetical protein RR854_00035 [Muribaculaceae bacterium]